MLPTLAPLLLTLPTSPVLPARVDALVDPLAVHASPDPLPQDPYSRPIPKRARWSRGQGVLQGFFGVQTYATAERDSGGPIDVEADDAQMPLLGGGGQWKLAGNRVDFGLEGMFSFGWQANAAAIAVGGGGAAVAVDVDMLVFDLYGGPFVNVFLGDKTRIYGAAGPLMQWADYAQDSLSSGYDDSGSGFGTGWYGRAGIEFDLGGGTWLGFGARYSDSSIDLGGGLGDLDLEGWQYALTVTNGF